MKYGVSVVCIAGTTSFIDHAGVKVGVGVCCWYFGNMKDAKTGVIQFGMFADTLDHVIASEEVDSDDDAEDEDDFGLTALFKSN
jgi:hypothetical protein